MSRWLLLCKIVLLAIFQGKSEVESQNGILRRHENTLANNHNDENDTIGAMRLEGHFLLLAVI